jgi:tRNA threonylcarbamoyladenosine biosynthesis protein TsaE
METMAIQEMITRSEAETEDVGRRFAERLSRGQVIHLLGDLGAGKTAFVRGLAQGLGVDPDEVSSPTFTLIQEYRGGRLALFHVDLYRLAGAEVPDLGLDSLAAEGVVAIEWASRLPEADTRAAIVRIEEVAPGDEPMVEADPGRALTGQAVSGQAVSGQAVSGKTVPGAANSDDPAASDHADAGAVAAGREDELNADLSEELRRIRIETPDLQASR